MTSLTGLFIPQQAVYEKIEKISAAIPAIRTFKKRENWPYSNPGVLPFDLVDHALIALETPEKLPNRQWSQDLEGFKNLLNNLLKETSFEATVESDALSFRRRNGNSFAMKQLSNAMSKALQEVRRFPTQSVFEQSVSDALHKKLEGVEFELSMKPDSVILTLPEGQNVKFITPRLGIAPENIHSVESIMKSVHAIGNTLRIEHNANRKTQDPVGPNNMLSIHYEDLAPIMGDNYVPYYRTNEIKVSK